MDGLDGALLFADFAFVKSGLQRNAVVFCVDGARCRGRMDGFLRFPFVSQGFMPSSRARRVSVRDVVFDFSVYRLGGLRDAVCRHRLLMEGFGSPRLSERGFLFPFLRLRFDLFGKLLDAVVRIVVSNDACRDFASFVLPPFLLKEKCVFSLLKDDMTVNCSVTERQNHIIYPSVNNKAENKEFFYADRKRIQNGNDKRPS